MRGPPLGMLKQVFSTCILKHIGLTRLGTDNGAADFGWVLGDQNHRFLQFSREKMEAKNELIFGRLENRFLRPQEQIADEVRRSVRVWEKEQKDGGRPLSQESEA